MEKSLERLEDEVLIQLLKEDDHDAFEVIFDRYWKRLYTFSRSLTHDDALAKEAIQNIMLALWERRATQHILNVEAYMMQAVKYQAAALIKEEHLRDIPETWWNQLESTLPDVEVLMYAEETENKVLTLINALPEACRKIFYLSRMEQLSNKEISGKMNISIRTVEKQLSKALKYLRTHLSV